eukprot:m.132250 g.132250  ORF g.132250 m.132250 type:complete len:304 (-) comp9830_c0_seq2:768-1679(-)
MLQARDVRGEGGDFAGLGKLNGKVEVAAAACRQLEGERALVLGPCLFHTGPCLITPHISALQQDSRGNWERTGVQLCAKPLVFPDKLVREEQHSGQGKLASTHLRSDLGLGHQNTVEKSVGTRAAAGLGALGGLAQDNDNIKVAVCAGCAPCPRSNHKAAHDIFVPQAHQLEHFAVVHDALRPGCGVCAVVGHVTKVVAGTNQTCFAEQHGSSRSQALANCCACAPQQLVQVVPSSSASERTAFPRINQTSKSPTQTRANFPATAAKMRSSSCSSPSSLFLASLMALVDGETKAWILLSSLGS